MEKSEKIDHLRLSFYKLVSYGVLDHRDKDLPLDQLLEKMFKRREEIENNISVDPSNKGLNQKTNKYGYV
jgi:hypothetical protein